MEYKYLMLRSLHLQNIIGFIFNFNIDLTGNGNRKELARKPGVWYLKLLYCKTNLKGILFKEETMDEKELLFSGTFIFDLDGTLVDSMIPYLDLVEYIYREIGLSAPMRETIAEVAGEGKSVFIELLPPDLPHREEIIRKCAKIGYSLWPAYFKEKVQLIAGSEEILKLIKEKGCKTGVVTNATKETLYFFSQKGLNKYIDVFITKDDVAEAKPAPDSINLCINRLGADCESSSYIGDAPLDIRAGSRAGAITIGVLTGLGSVKTLKRENPHAIINDITEIPKIFSI